MESHRLILFFVFSFSLFLLLDAWQREQRPAAPATAPAAQGLPGAAPGAASPVDPSLPPLPSAKLAPPPGPDAGPAPAASAALAAAPAVTVQTDVFRAEISTIGGDLRRLELTQHRDVDDPKTNFVLFQQRPDHVYVAQSGFIGGELPNHRTQFVAEAQQYTLAEGSDTLEVRLRAVPVNDVHVTKIYRFRRGSYVVDMTHEIVNKGAAPIQPYGYFQFLRDDRAPAGDSMMLPTYTGVAIYTEREKFQKVSFSDIEKGKATHARTSQDGWVALLQHYFLGAWLPQGDTQREFYTRRVNGLYAAGVIIPAPMLAPGASAVLTVPLYAGPQEQHKLAELAPGLDLAIDYGWLTIISVPLFWLLSWLYQWVGNWGTAIILLTVIIKLIFYPLSEASYRSMARMRVMAPKMQRLKEQYGDDRQRMQQAMMELYKTEKINPLGGCLPIVVQIPVFIALYWVLLASVELRHAPFMLWINDLSRPDPWFILPVLMGATMVIQTRLNPVPPDPIQAKVMKIMPVAFSIFFFFFPAGLVLYWLVNNILSIAQQWYINQKLERASLAAPRKA
jgi:YidC/Oxa1 family membrane protein insertase